MEDTVQIQNNIKKYIKSDKNFRKDIPEKYIGVQLKKIGGLSNINYSGVVKETKRLLKFFTGNLEHFRIPLTMNLKPL